MKRKITIAIILLLILIAYISCKVIILNKYKTDNFLIDNNSIFKQTLSIQYHQSNDTTSYEEMTYNNLFKDYENKDSFSFNVKYDEENKITSFYSITKEPQYINSLSIDAFELYNDKEELNETESNITQAKKFLNKNNIKDDIDLFNYIKQNYYLKSNLLTTINNIKNNYMINEFVQSTLPEFDSITLINSNDYKGYIINSNNKITIREIHILHNDNQYIIILSGNDITTDSFITSLLESIKFE